MLLSGFRNIAIDGNETINRHHRSTSQRNLIRESVDAYSLDGLLQLLPSSATNKAAKLLGTDFDKSMTLLSIKPIVFVQQMTIMQHHLYKQIPIAEMLSKKYTDPDKCPNLDLMKRWNAMVPIIVIHHSYLIGIELLVE